MASTPELAAAARAAARAARWTQQRDETVRKARAAGHSLREIALATGLSHGTIDNICKR